MELGIVKDKKAQCKLCKWPETAADFQKGCEALEKHLRKEHRRVMVSHEEADEGRLRVRVYSGVKWPGDMDTERRRRR